MSRTCTLNTANYMHVGSSATVDQLAIPMNGAPACSIHVFIRQRDAQTTTPILFQGWNNNAGAVTGYTQLAIVSGVARVASRAVSTDATQVTPGNTRILPGPWFAIGGISNFATTRQSIYVNGKLERTTVPTWGSTTYTNGASGGTAAEIGLSAALPPGSSSSFFDGLISELAIWKVALNDGEMAALARGMSALLIRPASLLFYVPFIGRASPEKNLGSLGATGDVTIVGTCLEGPPPPLFDVDLISGLDANALRLAAFKAAWARGANLPVLGTGNY